MEQQLNYAIIRLKTFIGNCQDMSNREILDELAKISNDARELGLEDAADQLCKTLESLNKRYKVGICQN